MVKEVLSKRISRSTPKQRRHLERIGRRFLRQRTFGRAFAVMRQRAARRAQNAAIGPVGWAAIKVTMIVGKARGPVRQAAFDAAVRVGSGEHGRLRFSPVECRVDSEFNARRRDCKIRVTKFDVYVKRTLEAA